MGLKTDEVITDTYILREGYISRNGFVFVKGQSNPTVYSRLLIRAPERARCDINVNGYSSRTLREHIDLINEYQIEKVMVICDDLGFITECPSVTDIVVYPSLSAGNNFDYSPLYQLPSIHCVDCRTVYGECDKYKTDIDYSKIKNLWELAMIGSGHIKYNEVLALKKLWISGNKQIRDFSEVSNSPTLKSVTLYLCGIQSLAGIEKHLELESLVLYSNRSLNNISRLENIKKTLKKLVIESCPKIMDFSVLNYLTELEHLQLFGNNVLPNLDFLKQMKRLKTFTFTMEVKNGDLSNCLNIPYVSCKNYRHYNFKDKDLPKN